MFAKRVLYTGRVQGVGFRYSTKQVAAGFEVQGEVRNLEDGRVELQVMSWDDAELDEFLQEILDSQLGSLIKETEIEDIPPLENVRGFSIVQ